jgi:hypothetical protein
MTTTAKSISACQTLLKPEISVGKGLKGIQLVGKKAASSTSHRSVISQSTCLGKDRKLSSVGRTFLAVSRKRWQKLFAGAGIHMSNMMHAPIFYSSHLPCDTDQREFFRQHRLHARLTRRLVRSRVASKISVAQGSAGLPPATRPLAAPER